MLKLFTEDGRKTRLQERDVIFVQSRKWGNSNVCYVSVKRKGCRLLQKYGPKPQDCDNVFVVKDCIPREVVDVIIGLLNIAVTIIAGDYDGGKVVLKVDHI